MNQKNESKLFLNETRNMKFRENVRSKCRTASWMRSSATHTHTIILKKVDVRLLQFRYADAHNAGSVRVVDEETALPELVELRCAADVGDKSKTKALALGPEYFPAIILVGIQTHNASLS